MVSSLSRIWQKLTMNVTSNGYTCYCDNAWLNWVSRDTFSSEWEPLSYLSAVPLCWALPGNHTSGRPQVESCRVWTYSMSWCLLVMSFSLLPLQLLRINSIRIYPSIPCFLSQGELHLVQKLSLPMTLLVFGKVVGEEESPQRRKQRVRCGFKPHVPCLHCRRVPQCIMHRPAIRPERTHLVLHFIAPDPFWSCFLWPGAFLLI